MCSCTECEAWVGELAEDYVLASEEVDGVVDVLLEFVGRGDCGVDEGL